MMLGLSKGQLLLLNIQARKPCDSRATVQLRPTTTCALHPVITTSEPHNGLFDVLTGCVDLSAVGGLHVDGRLPVPG